MSIKDNVKAKVESNKTLNRFFGGRYRSSCFGCIGSSDFS